MPGSILCGISGFCNAFCSLFVNFEKFPQSVIREKRKSQSWLPVLEKHDIPIVVGVGVSLAFIFIAMAFYSLFRKNDPATITTGRAGKRPSNS